MERKESIKKTWKSWSAANKIEKMKTPSIEKMV